MGLTSDRLLASSVSLTRGSIPATPISGQFKELSDAMSDVIFVKIDVDENPDTAAKYQVSAMPTFLFIKAGEVVDRLMGASPARLQELIAEHK
jgi:thioredoxin 1